MPDSNPATEPGALTLEGFRHVIEEIIPFNRQMGLRLAAAGAAVALGSSTFTVERGARMLASSS